MKDKSAKFQLLEDVRAVIVETQGHIVRNVNSAMVIAYFQIGNMILEDEQHGNSRAAYARETISRLSAALTREFGPGYSVDNLERFRKFYLTYKDRISASVMRKSATKAVLPSKEVLRKHLV